MNWYKLTKRLVKERIVMKEKIFRLEQEVARLENNKAKVRRQKLKKEVVNWIMSKYPESFGFKEMLRKYLCPDGIADVLIQRDGLLSKVANDSHWKGGDITVPFEGKNHEH